MRIPKSGRIDITPKEIGLLKLLVEHKGLMLLIVGVAHLLLYLFTKPEWLVISVSPHDELSLSTALNTTLENMILGVGKNKDYDTYLPECREMAGCLADMIHDILETSKEGMIAENEEVAEVDLSELLSSLCEPYMLIAKAKGIIFRLGLYIVDTLLKTMDISYSFCPMEELQGMRFTIHL